MKNLLQDTLKSIRREYGKESVMTFKHDEEEKIETVSSGSLLLDEALGHGGYPKGRIIEIYGPESAGKTTLALQAIAECQKQGGIVSFIDAEHSIDPQYAQKLGVNIDELIIAQPDSGEQALDICETLIKSGSINMIVVDSVAALVPEVELRGEMSDQTIGAQARLMSKALRKVSGNVSKTGCILIFINQLREKVGVVFGNPEVTPGGRALKFYTTQRLEVRRGERLKEGAELIGQVMNIKVVKNKVYTPYKTASVELIYGEGISFLSELSTKAVEKNVIKKAGSWYSYGEERVAQGKKALVKWMKEHTDKVEEIKKQVL